MTPPENDNRPPLNRAQRRATRRLAAAGLRAEGCTCKVIITPDAVPVGDFAETGSVEHEVGCPLMIRVALARLAGRDPGLVVTSVGRCGR